MTTTNRKLRILIVEDRLLTVEQLTQIVQSGVSDLTVALTTSESAAISQLQSATPDMVILDLNLKNDSGFNVLRVAKEMEKPPVVVALVKEGQTQDRERAIRMGANFFLDRDGDMETLASIVRAVETQRLTTPPEDSKPDQGSEKALSEVRTPDPGADPPKSVH